MNGGKSRHRVLGGLINSKVSKLIFQFLYLG